MSDWANEDFTEGNALFSMERAVTNHVVGRLLGRGAARSVYVYRPNPDYVIKLERNGSSFSNVAEWTLWCDAQDTEFGKWLAPIHSISSCGRVLIMKRTDNMTWSKDLPEKVPLALATDAKVGNWGLLDGKPVCHDYGHHNALTVGLSMRMKRVQWSTALA